MGIAIGRQVMEMNAYPYIYLFPYEKISCGSKIVIYGAGDVGQAYLQQMLMTHYCEVVGFVDRNYDKYPSMIVPVYSPKDIEQLSFDYIVLAFKMRNFAEDVRMNLVVRGIEKEKIIFQGARTDISVFRMSDGYSSSKNLKPFAFRRAPLSIALKYGPGLGDAIIKKRLFVEITKMAPEALIDIYAPGGSKFIPSLYSDQPQLNQVIDDGGALYTAHHKEYSLSMTIFFIILTDHIEYERIKEICPAFAEQMKTHIECHKRYGLHPYPSTQNAIHFLRAFYRGWNCYTLYRYTDVFQIKDTHVDIPLLPSFKDEWEAMRLGKYVTLNFGTGAASKGNQHMVSKQWPKAYFEKFVRLFKEKYPSISILQVGDLAAEKIQGADRYILGKNLELVKYILKGALFHLDIEGGLMHLATQIGTKCIVLYGTTPANLFSYPQNINITSMHCTGCYCLYDNSYTCAKGLQRPECMYSIAPEMVVEKVKEYLAGTM